MPVYDDRATNYQHSATNNRLPLPNDSCGMTPLHLAAEQGNLVKVRTLLEQGEPPNSLNSHGWTPMMLAAKAGHTTIIHLLSTYGAHPISIEHILQQPLPDCPPPTWLSKLCGNFHASNTINCLIINGMLTSPLHAAIYFGQLNVVRLFLQHIEKLCSKAFQIASAPNPMDLAYTLGSSTNSLHLANRALKMMREIAITHMINIEMSARLPSLDRLIPFSSTFAKFIYNIQQYRQHFINTVTTTCTSSHQTLRATKQTIERCYRRYPYVQTNSYEQDSAHTQDKVIDVTREMIYHRYREAVEAAEKNQRDQYAEAFIPSLQITSLIILTGIGIALIPSGPLLIGDIPADAIINVMKTIILYSISATAENRFITHSLASDLLSEQGGKHSIFPTTFHGWEEANEAAMLPLYTLPLPMQHSLPLVASAPPIPVISDQTTNHRADRDNTALPAIANDTAFCSQLMLGRVMIHIVGKVLQWTPPFCRPPIQLSSISATQKHLWGEQLAACQQLLTLVKKIDPHSYQILTSIWHDHHDAFIAISQSTTASTEAIDCLTEKVLALYQDIKEVLPPAHHRTPPSHSKHDHHNQQNSHTAAFFMPQRDECATNSTNLSMSTHSSTRLS